MRVEARAIFPNCPRYIPDMQMTGPSIYTPQPQCEPPEPALNLIFLVQLKLLAAKAGITKLTADGDQVVLQFGERQRANLDLIRGRFGQLLTVGRTQVRLNRTQAGPNWLGVLQEVIDAAGATAEPTAASAARPVASPKGTG